MSRRRTRKNSPSCSVAASSRFGSSCVPWLCCNWLKAPVHLEFRRVVPLTAAGHTHHRPPLPAGRFGAALFEKQRPGAAAVLDDSQKQRIIAMVCSNPPEGRARWTVRLVAEEAVKRKLVPRVGRETIRILLLEPRPQAVAGKKCGAWPNSMTSTSPKWKTCWRRMRSPMIRQNRWSAWMRNRSRCTPTCGRPRRQAGTRSAARQRIRTPRYRQCLLRRRAESRSPFHLRHTQPFRLSSSREWPVELATAYREAKTIHLVMDNLNIHRRKSLTDAFGMRNGHRDLGSLYVHYTPKHGSWLNQAEIEIGLFSRQCLGNRRIPDLKTLHREKSCLEPPYEPRPSQDQLEIRPPGRPSEVWLQMQILQAVKDLGQWFVVPCSSRRSLELVADRDEDSRPESFGLGYSKIPSQSAVRIDERDRHLRLANMCFR